MASLASIESNTWGISTKGYGVIVEGLAVIRQRIDLVLRTSKGSDPLWAEFGSDIYKFVDTPSNTAIPNIKKEIIQALETWMPEIKVTTINHYFKSVSNPVFQITYSLTDEDLIDKLSFELNGDTYADVESEIILKAYFPANPNNGRYQIALVKNDSFAAPFPPVGGFITIQSMFDWVNANWFFLGRWFLLSDMIVCYMDSKDVKNASLSINVKNVTVIKALFPDTLQGQIFKVVFNENGNPVVPAIPEVFITAEEVLSYAKENWSSYGDWSITGENDATSRLNLVLVANNTSEYYLKITGILPGEDDTLLDIDDEELVNDLGEALLYK